MHHCEYARRFLCVPREQMGGDPGRPVFSGGVLEKFERPECTKYFHAITFTAQGAVVLMRDDGNVENSLPESVLLRLFCNIAVDVEGARPGHIVPDGEVPLAEIEKRMGDRTIRSVAEENGATLAYTNEQRRSVRVVAPSQAAADAIINEIIDCTPFILSAAIPAQPGMADDDSRLAV